MCDAGSGANLCMYPQWKNGTTIPSHMPDIFASLATFGFAELILAQCALATIFQALCIQALWVEILRSFKAALYDKGWMSFVSTGRAHQHHSGALEYKVNLLILAP